MIYFGLSAFSRGKYLIYGYLDPPGKIQAIEPSHEVAGGLKYELCGSCMSYNESLGKGGPVQITDGYRVRYREYIMATFVTEPTTKGDL